MKKIITTLCLIFGLIPVFAQNGFLAPKVDERTELLSIVFRLAGAQEYVNNHIVSYAQDIDEHFDLYKDHEIISFAQQLRMHRGVGYDAVMSFAINIEIKDGIIHFGGNLADNSLESRWNKESADEFLKLLNDFYIKSNFHDFFIAHQELYAIAEQRFAGVLKIVDFSWFKEFYGTVPEGNFITIISLCNGGGNYGPSVTYLGGHQDLYSIIGSWAIDSTGLPVYREGIISTIVHEYNHSFCNPLINQYYSQMERKAGDFFALVAPEMEQQAYGNDKTMLNEILVRACVIKYQQKAYGDAYTPRLISQEQGNGFLWIDYLVKSLDTYTANREKYPTLKDFMLEIVKLQNSLSPKKIQKELDKKMPVIVGTNIRNNDRNVDPDLTEIIVKFDRPMYTKANGSTYGRQGKDFMPEFKSAKWNENSKKEWIITVQLKPDTEYSISFPGRFFMSPDYVSAKGVYYLDFKTGKSR